MNIFALILCLFWGGTGMYLTICSIPRLRKYQVKCILNTEHPVGIFLIGLILLIFVGLQLIKWQLGENPSIIWSW